MISEVTCPRCHGKRVLLALVCGVGKDVPCPTCHGKGSVTEGRLRRIEAGWRRHQERLDRGKTLREEARDLGISPAKLSALERGDEV